MKFKKLISLGLSLVMALSLAVPAMAEEETTEETVEPYVVSEDVKGGVVILHSNDVHGAVEGYAKMATLKAMFEEAGASVILADAGDFSQGETSVSVSEGATAIELMNLAGYDVAAPGNHEFDYGYANLKTLEEKAEFPILAANILYEGEVALGTNTVIEAGGLKIGFFGLDTPETATKAHPAKIKGVTFAGSEDMYKVAEEQIKELKAAKADYIICLGHLGIDDETAVNANRSIDLLEKVEGIDVFIDGHSHSTEEQIVEKTNADRKVGDTVLTSTGTKFANIGVVTIKDGVITSECVDTRAITVAEDDAVAVRAAEIRAEIEADYGTVFAKSEVDLNGDKAPGNRTEETNLGDLICDAMLWLATKEDLGVPAENVIALTNGGGIRAPIAAGDVAKKDVNTVLPFGNTVAVDYVTGEVLLEALEASTFCTPTSIGGFPQVAGIEFTVNVAYPFDAGENYPGTTYAAPASINRVTIDSINGKEFDPEATYAVVTNDFVAAGGDTYYSFSVSDKITDTGVPLDEAVMQYITDVLDGVIGEEYAEPQGRITIVDPIADFTDVSNEDWFAPAVRLVVLNKVMIGTSDTTFSPEENITTATVLQMMFNIQKNIAAHNGEELKVSEDPEAWYTDAVNWAKEAGLITEFEGDGEIVRGDVLDLLNSFREMNEMEEITLMHGNEHGDLMLDKVITRMEMAQVMNNFLMA